MPDGGTILIAARNAGKKVQIVVTDSGFGMPAEVQSHVFEPFFTTKEVGKGSGLGLAQVYAFVTRSKGSVTVDSEVGRGTTVKVSFPRSYKPVAAYEPKRNPRDDVAVGAGAGGPSRHVLLVEDDRTVATLMMEVLESIGHSATHVVSADAALGLLASGREIDVVLSDVMMPGGMSGVDLAREIRRRRSDMPVVLATGYIEVARGAVAEGFQVLVKPYQPETLARTLASLFETRESA
jgi:CheY-like chemotaxis protein